MDDHVLGTDMSTKCASPYACLTIGFKEEETLSNSKLLKYFTLEDIQTIKLSFKKCMETVSNQK